MGQSIFFFFFLPTFHFVFSPHFFVVAFKKCFLFLVDFLFIYVLSSQLSQFSSYLNENSGRFVFSLKNLRVSSVGQQPLFLPESSPPSGLWCVRSCRWAGRSWRCWRAHPAPCPLSAGTAGRTAPRSPRRTGRGRGMEAGPWKEDLKSQHRGI